MHTVASGDCCVVPAINVKRVYRVMLDHNLVFERRIEQPGVPRRHVGRIAVKTSHTRFKRQKTPQISSKELTHSANQPPITPLTHVLACASTFPAIAV